MSAVQPETALPLESTDAQPPTQQPRWRTGWLRGSEGLEPKPAARVVIGLVLALGAVASKYLLDQESHAALGLPIQPPPHDEPR